MKTELPALLNFAAWIVFTALAFALLWTGRASVLVMIPSLTWLLPTVDWVTIFDAIQKEKP